MRPLSKHLLSPRPIRSVRQKRDTFTSNPREWLSYPTLTKYSFLSLSSLAHTPTLSKDIKDGDPEWVTELLHSRRSDKSIYSLDSLFRMDDMDSNIPIAHVNNRVIENRKEYFTQGIEILDKAFGMPHSVIAPRGLFLENDEEDWLVEQLLAQISSTDASKCLGPDGVHGAWIKYFDLRHPGDIGRVKRLLKDGLKKDNLFSSRVVLIPKVNGKGYRPVQIENYILRLVEKSIARYLETIPLANGSQMHGYIKGKSPHTAINSLMDILRTNSRQEIVFLDISRAFSCVDRQLLIDILSSTSLPPIVLRILSNLIHKQNIQLLDVCIDSGVGISQGSSISPLLFNIYYDRCISDIKLHYPTISTILYADDTVIIGRVDISSIQQIYSRYNLSINTSKSCTFNQSIKSIPRRRTYNYLGIRIKDNGCAVGYTGVVKKIRKIADRLRVISRHNVYFAHLLTVNIIGGILRYQGEVHPKAKIDYLSAIKRVHRLPRGIDTGTVNSAITFVHKLGTGGAKKKGLKCVLGLLRLHGMQEHGGLRTCITWNNSWTIDDIVNETSHIKSLRRIKIPKRSTPIQLSDRTNETKQETTQIEQES